MRAAILPYSTASSARALCPASPPGKIAHPAGGESVLRRRAHVRLDATGPHVEQRERTDGRGLIPPPAPCTTKARSMGRPRNVSAISPRHLHTERADQMQRRLRGIDQRSQDVEHGAHAQRCANRGERFGGRMVVAARTGR